MYKISYTTQEGAAFLLKHVCLLAILDVVARRSIMPFVQLLVEDEFTEDHKILHSELDFFDVFNSQEMLDFLKQELSKQTSPETPKQFLQPCPEKDTWKKFAVVSLQCFVSANWFRTKTPIKEDTFELLTRFFPDVKKYLEITDEAYFDLKLLPLLAIAKFVLGKLAGASIWKARYLIVHQIILSVPSTSLYLELKRTLLSFEGFLTDAVSTREAIFLKSQVAVELAQSFLFYTDVGSSKPLLDSVKEFSGINVEFSGALGTRTKFQTKATSQLFVKISRASSFIQEVAGDNIPKHLNHPNNVCLDDDNLLNEIKFSDESETLQNILLSPEEQLILLCLASHMKRMSSYAESDSINEELMTLLEYIINHASVWSIRYETLHMRSIMERNNNKRMDRAMVQLNHLVDAFDEFEAQRKKDNSILLENMKYFYGSLVTSRWTAQKNLADTLCNLGCVKSALDVYQELKSWEEMVHCLQVLDRKGKAEEVVKEQIAIQGETPFLLCLLADATDDPELYEKAWNVSGNKYFRAKRDLGNYFFKRKDYQTCKEHYQESLRLNSLQISIWQRLGFAALDTEDYELAVRAYRRFVEFEPDVFEAWNNMAKAYIKLDKKIIAYSTLQEAIKCNYEEWRLWDNYLTVSVDVGSFDEVIRSWHRLIELKGKFEDDAIIEILVKAVLSDVKDMNGNSASKMSGRLLKLLARIKGTAYNSFTLWISYAKLLLFLEKDLDSIVDVIRRANRSVAQLPNWDKEPVKVQTVLDSIQLSLSILNQACDRESDQSKKKTAVSSTKLTLESLVRGTEKAMSSWDPSKVDLKSLNDSLVHVQQLITKLNQ